MLTLSKYEAKTKEEALENALKELNVKEEDLFLKSEFVEGKLFKASKYIVSVIKKDDIKEYIDNFVGIDIAVLENGFVHPSSA